MNEENENLDRLSELGDFRCIVADPPWRPSLHANNPRRATLDKAGPQKHYPTMLLDDICSIQPPSAKQCHLWLWVLTQHVDWAFSVQYRARTVVPQGATSRESVWLGRESCSCDWRDVV